MLAIDLKAADIEPATDSLVVDFHALRGNDISNLAASSASVKVCQVSARHSTPRLTIGIYAKADLHDIKGTVEALPDPTASRPNPEAPGRDRNRGENRASCYRLRGAGIEPRRGGWSRLSWMGRTSRLSRPMLASKGVACRHRPSS
jgi:hypothetical protein